MCVQTGRWLATEIRSVFFFFFSSSIFPPRSVSWRAFQTSCTLVRRVFINIIINYYNCCYWYCYNARCVVGKSLPRNARRRFWNEQKGRAVICSTYTGITRLRPLRRDVNNSGPKIRSRWTAGRFTARKRPWSIWIRRSKTIAVRYTIEFTNSGKY